MQEFLTPSSDVPANLTESPGLLQPEGGSMGDAARAGTLCCLPLRLGAGNREVEIGVCLWWGRGAGALPGWKNGVGSEKGEGMKETIGN